MGSSKLDPCVHWKAEGQKTLKSKQKKSTFLWLPRNSIRVGFKTQMDKRLYEKMKKSKVSSHGFFEIRPVCASLQKIRLITRRLFSRRKFDWYSWGTGWCFKFSNFSNRILHKSTHLDKSNCLSFIIIFSLTLFRTFWIYWFKRVRRGGGSYISLSGTAPQWWFHLQSTVFRH